MIGRTVTRETHCLLRDCLDEARCRIGYCSQLFSFFHALVGKNLSQGTPQRPCMPFVHQTEPMPGIPAATITSPGNNMQVESSVLVQGTAQNITGEYRLWLTVYDYNSNRHYPQGGPVAVSSEGKWHRAVSLESNGRHDVTAVAADQHANETLLQYRAASRSKADYPGLRGLPPGCTTLASVTVVRT